MTTVDTGLHGDQACSRGKMSHRIESSTVIARDAARLGQRHVKDVCAQHLLNVHKSGCEKGLTPERRVNGVVMSTFTVEHLLSVTLVPDKSTQVLESPQISADAEAETA